MTVEQCPQCGGRLILDEWRGELICQSCGLVVAERLPTEEYEKQFSSAKERDRQEKLREAANRIERSVSRDRIQVSEGYAFVFSILGKEYDELVRDAGKGDRDAKLILALLGHAFVHAYNDVRAIVERKRKRRLVEIVMKMLVVQSPGRLKRDRRYRSILNKLAYYVQRPEEEILALRRSLSEEFLKAVRDTLSEEEKALLDILLKAYRNGYNELLTNDPESLLYLVLAVKRFCRKKYVEEFQKLRELLDNVAGRCERGEGVFRDRKFAFTCEKVKFLASQSTAVLKRLKLKPQEILLLKRLVLRKNITIWAVYKEAKRDEKVVSEILATPTAILRLRNWRKFALLVRTRDINLFAGQLIGFSRADVKLHRDVVESIRQMFLQLREKRGRFQG